MGNPTVLCYVDILSPFGYLAYYMLRHNAAFKNVDIVYKPVLLGGIMKACGNTAPLFIKNKDKWISKERLRWASQFQIPMREDMPPGFPPSTINCQRILCALELKDPSKLTIACDRLFAAHWAPDTLKNAPHPKGHEYDIKNPEVVAELLSDDSVLGSNLTKELLTAIGSAEVKNHLSKNTENAIANGAFGLPWLHCTNSKGDVEGFWGFDHLGQVSRFLDVEDVNSGGQLRPML